MSPHTEIKYFKRVILLTLVSTSLTIIFLNVRLFQVHKTTVTTVQASHKPVRNHQQLPPWASLPIVQEYGSNRNRKIDRSNSNNSCRIPNLEPFHPSILHLLTEEPSPLICENKEFPLLFNSKLEPSPRLVPTPKIKSVMVDLNMKSCCFRKLVRMRGTDNRILYTRECRTLSLEDATEVPVGWEFVMIECEFYCSIFCWLRNVLTLNLQGNVREMDFHTFIHKPKTTSTDQGSTAPRIPPPLNVMILGLDSMSRMSFLRTLPEVHLFLRNTLSAIEMTAYNKIGENTFPNIAPMLTNRRINQYRDIEVLDCVGGEGTFSVDRCPFIWKSYKSAGYQTLFAEDYVSLAIFNFKHHYFQDPPTDHYFRPFSLGVDRYAAHDYACYGPRPEFQVMMDYMEKMARTMFQLNQPFFQFAMSGSVTHSHLNGGRGIVNYLLESLQRLHHDGIFNNTVFILMSDHGSRSDHLRSFPQGFLEDRLPLMYIALPQWFRAKYPNAFTNLRRNSKILSTPRDIYRTLEDLVNPEEALNPLKIKERERKLNFVTGGISLFLQLPRSRTCKTAGIPEEFCSCNMRMNPVSVKNWHVVEGAKHAVKVANSIVAAYPTCASFNLKSILQAEKIDITSNPRSEDRDGNNQMYRIVFETSPGAAKFEALLRFEYKTAIGGGGKRVSANGTVGRVNMFKGQSGCVEDENVKAYCVCTT